MKILKTGLLIVGMGGLVYLLSRKRNISLGDKASRSISLSPSYCFSGLNGVLNVDLPGVNAAYYNEADIPQNKARIAQIKSRYGRFVEDIATITNLLPDILYSFIFIESRGEAGVVNGNAVGLMQVGVISATDIIFNEYRKGRLNTAEENILRRHLGTRYNEIISMKSLGLRHVITKNDLLYPELNILIGAIYLGQLIDQHIENEKLRLDKVVVRYNMGYYAFGAGRQLIGDTLAIVNKVNPTTRAYITKLIGKNGILEMLAAEHCGG